MNGILVRGYHRSFTVNSWPAWTENRAARQEKTALSQVPHQVPKGGKLGPSKPQHF